MATARLATIAAVAMLAGAASGALAGPAQADGDEFVERHRAAVELNIRGFRFSVRLLGDKAWFYQGELIPIELTYESLDGGWHGSQTGGDVLTRYVMDVTIDHPEGVTFDPGRDLLESIRGHAVGGDENARHARSCARSWARSRAPAARGATDRRARHTGGDRRDGAPRHECPAPAAAARVPR